MMFFADVIPVPGWNFNHYFAWLLDHRLASKAGIQLQIGRHVETIGFVIVHLAQRFFPLLHPDVARSARAIPAARVIQK